MVQRLCHCGMPALQELCFSCQIKSTSLPLHSMRMLLNIYSQPSITFGGFSSLRHALHHHRDVAQNMRWLYLLWVTYMSLNSCIKHSCIFSSCLQLCFSWLLSLHQVSCGIRDMLSRGNSVLVIHSEEAQEVVNSQPSLPIIFILTMKMIRRAANRKILKRGLRLFGDPFFPMTQHPSDINNEVICT